MVVVWDLNLLGHLQAHKVTINPYTETESLPY